MPIDCVPRANPELNARTTATSSQLATAHRPRNRMPINTKKIGRLTTVQPIALRFW
jgi:hypothetical protein